jgi:hypothetical protein
MQWHRMISASIEVMQPKICDLRSSFNIWPKENRAAALRYADLSSCVVVRDLTSDMCGLDVTIRHYE